MGHNFAFFPCQLPSVFPSFLSAPTPPSVLPNPLFFVLPSLHVHHSHSSATALSSPTGMLHDEMLLSIPGSYQAKLSFQPNRKTPLHPMTHPSLFLLDSPLRSRFPAVRPHLVMRYIEKMAHFRPSYCFGFNLPHLACHCILRKNKHIDNYN